MTIGSGCLRQTVGLLLLFIVAAPSFAQSAHSPFDSYEPQFEQLNQTGRWQDLERLARQVASLAQSGSPVDVVRADAWLIRALKAQGRFADAEAVAREALNLSRKTAGTDTADSLNVEASLGDLLLLERRPADAEPVLRDTLRGFEKLYGPESMPVAEMLAYLAMMLQTQRRFDEAEPLMRRAFELKQKLPGAESPATATLAIKLAAIEVRRGRFGDAEPLLRRAIAINDKALGPDQMASADSVYQLAVLLQAEGRFDEAEALLRQLQIFNDKHFGPDDLTTVAFAARLAEMLRAQGHYAEAEALYRRVLEVREKKMGPENPQTAASVTDLGGVLDSEGHYADAEVFYRRALAIYEKAYPADHPAIAIASVNLASLLDRHGPAPHSDVEPLLRRALAIEEKSFGPEHPYTATTLAVLAAVLQGQGRLTEAEPLFRRALAIREKKLGAENSATADSAYSLASNLADQHRYAEADPLFTRALTVAEKRLGADNDGVATVRQSLAQSEANQQKWADAVGNYRLACAARTNFTRARTLSGEAAPSARADDAFCWVKFCVALAKWSAQGGGPAAGDRPAALMLESFIAGQRTLQSAAGEAMAHSGALAAANSAGMAAQAQDYEAALVSREKLDAQFTQSENGDADAGAEKRAMLAKARTVLLAHIDALAAELKSKAPLYWDYRSPEPLSIESLQSKSGADAALLRPEEALIAFVIMPGKIGGLIFAVTKDRFAWALPGMNGEDLKVRVAKLRSQIDPEGYAVPGAPAVDADGTGAFDRQIAYELYRALLGDAGIQDLIKDKPVLLFVPSGPLTTLPPGLLVTAPPQGGREGDKDPDTLRATPWLLRSKAVALLPSVSSLRTLREILPAARKIAPDPLLVFADPDFSKVTSVQKRKPVRVAARGFASYFRDGVPIADALQDVPTLPGTRIEGEALEKALNGKPGSLLLGRQASKAQLMQRNKDGRLAQVRVLEFATHGLVAGFASDLAEPALLLAAGDKPSDELLLASEAATLNLNADWVLLSACNTASPDEPEAQGLSGLSRAFFFAGARSLLVSHWRVRDDVAPLLIPAMLLAERQNVALSRAQALQQATLAVLDNRALDAASPAAWAPFTLIGEAAR